MLSFILKMYGNEKYKIFIRSLMHRIVDKLNLNTHINSIKIHYRQNILLSRI